jgi:tRNA (mo5U34)-methyltransferase
MTDKPSSEIGLGRIEDYFWWHSIRLNSGAITPGNGKNIECMDLEISRIFDPLDLKGKSVLDVGAWNGGFSIEAKRRGAARVVALDRWASTDAILRARETFELAKRLCEVEIEAVEQELDIPQLSLDYLGDFDIVLFLGVFYHLVDPITALREIAQRAKEVLVLETHIEHSQENRPMMVFFPSDELSGDHSNWWGPNTVLITKLLNHFGFSDVRYSDGSGHTRGIFHAFRGRPETRVE